MDRHENLARLERLLYEAVPPIDPGHQFWLTSDCSDSYCYDCVDIARGKEFELGRPLARYDAWASHTPYEQRFYEGIDGGFQTSGDDSPRACAICRCTLDYTLTDYGGKEELAYYAENPGFLTVGPEDSYAISQICLNLTWSGAPDEQVDAATKIVEDALKAVIQT